MIQLAIALAGVVVLVMAHIAHRQDMKQGRKL